MTMQSETIGALAAALAKAQSKITFARKDSQNPHFRSKYADLASVWDACRGPLTDNGLAVIQTSVERDGRLYIVTTLVHSSGEWIKGEFPVIATKNDAQGYGSATTYAKRYALAAIAGVAPDDDDDGEAAVGRAPVKEQPKARAEGDPAVKIYVDRALKEVAAIVTEQDLDAWERRNEKALTKLAGQEPEQREKIGAALAATYQRITNQKEAAE